MNPREVLSSTRLAGGRTRPLCDASVPATTPPRRRRMHGRAQATGTGAPDPNRGPVSGVPYPTGCGAYQVGEAQCAGGSCGRVGREDSMTQPNTRGPAAPPTREALRRELRSGFRRALGLTALGTVVPGAGLTRTRSRKIGWVLLILALASLVAGAYYVHAHRPDERRAVDRRAARRAADGRRRLRRRRHPLVRLHHPHRGPVAPHPAGPGPHARARGLHHAHGLPRRGLVLQVRRVRQHHADDRRKVFGSTPVRPGVGRRWPRATTRGPTRRASTSCCSAPTPAWAARGRAPTR